MAYSKVFNTWSKQSKYFLRISYVFDKLESFDISAIFYRDDLFHLPVIELIWLTFLLSGYSFFAIFSYYLWCDLSSVFANKINEVINLDICYKIVIAYLWSASWNGLSSIRGLLLRVSNILPLNCLALNLFLI